MKPALTVALLLAFLALNSACQTNTKVIKADLRTQSGVYLVGYSREPLARRDFEDQLQSDLSAGGMIAHASHADIPNILDSSAEEVFRFAKLRNVVAIVIVNPVNDSPIEERTKVQANSPTVRAFFKGVRGKEVPITTNDVFAEVNAYVVDGDTATLAWSGVTATFRPTDRAQAIADLSATVANALRDAQKRLRSP